MDVLLALLAAFGVGFTGFLSYRLAKNVPIPCFVFTEDSCQRFRSSRYVRFLGIPNPYLGLPGFAVLFVMVVAHGLGAIPFWPIALVVGVFGDLLPLPTLRPGVCGEGMVQLARHDDRDQLRDGARGRVDIPFLTRFT